MVVPDEIVSAACHGDTAAIQAWFSTGTRDPDELVDGENTLLYAATWGGHCETMRLLLQMGAGVNARSDAGRETPLHAAAMQGHHDAAVLLLDRGALVDARAGLGSTPLKYAVQHAQRSDPDRCDIIRLLLRRGATLDARVDGWLRARRQWLDWLDAEAVASRSKATALLADVRLAGGTWSSYLRVPRKRLLALRVLCERGRATTDDDLLRRLFPAVRKKEDGAADEPPPPAVPLPKEVFWLVCEFLRCDRDDE